MGAARKKAVHRTQSWWTRRPRVLALAASIVFLVLTIYFWRAAIEVEILYPEAQDDVGAHLAVGGISKGLRGSLRIGVAVYSDGVYHFHYGHTLVSSDGSWCSPHVVVGEEGDYGKNFTVIALLITDQVRLDLRDNLRDPKRKPLTVLPKQATIVDEIPVHRRSQGDASDALILPSSNCPAFPMKPPGLSERQIPYTLNLFAAVASLLGLLASVSQFLFGLSRRSRTVLSPHRRPSGTTVRRD
jgi:hypothetical protein